MKFWQIFMAIGDGMTLCQYVVICLAIQISVLVTRPGCLAIHFIPAPSPCQKNLLEKCHTITKL